MRTRRGKFVISAMILFIATFLIAFTVKAQESSVQIDNAGNNSIKTLREERTKPVRVALLENPPVIDGRIDESEWAQSAVLKDFYQTHPGDNTEPSWATKVMLGYDANNFYIAIHAADERGKVRATVAKRDDVLNDDYVRVFLDTFDDKRRAYVLIFNPLGVQQDGVITEGSEPDYSIDVLMESKGVVTEDGYTIEVAIPFRSLRYEAGKGKSWGIQVQRRIKHQDEEDSWMPLVRGNASFLAQTGHITGLDQIAAERAFEIIPSITVSETGKRVRTLPRANASNDLGRFVNQPVDLDPGLTLKLGITPNATLDLALNPDFAQVEADQHVVTANQRFPIFFEEKRPFFLEGIDIFQTPIKAVHTRTIIDPDVAIKLSGKRARNSFGLLLASDNAPGNFSEEERTDPAVRPSIERVIDKNAYVGVLRLKRDVGKESNIGLIATSYNFVEKHNQITGFDGRFGFNPQTILTFQMLGTTSRRFFYEPELDQDVYRNGNGFGYYTQLQHSSRHLNLTLTGRGYTPDYRADVGFTSRTDTNPWDLLLSYNSEPNPQSKLISWSLTSASHAQFDWKGRMQYSYQSWRTQWNFKRQTYLKTDVYTDYQRLFEEEYGPKRTAQRQGAFIGASERSTVWKGFTIEAGTAPSKKYSASILIDYSWNPFDYDLGAGPRFPRVSPAALLNPNAPFDPGPGDTNDIHATFDWQPTDAMRFTFDYTKSRLKRKDTKRVAFDQNLPSLGVAYQFTRFTFARARIDYDSILSNVRGQFLLGWAPNPGTAFYIGYNDDLNRNGYNPFSNRYEPGIHRNNRTFFIKMSYLFRRSF